MNGRTLGQQFRARFLKTSAPASIEDIEKDLGSGMDCRQRSGDSGNVKGFVSEREGSG